MITKKCTKCGEEKEANSKNFWKNKSVKAGLAAMCIPCQAAKNKAWREANKEELSKRRKEKYVYAKPKPIPKVKTCTKCKIEKPYTKEYFHKQKGTKSGLRASCKVCEVKKNKEYRQKEGYRDRANKAMREWRKKNPEKAKAVTKRFREKHGDRLNEKRREKYKNDEEWRKRCIEYDKKYKESGKRFKSNNKPENRERARAYSKKWRLKNPEKKNKYNKMVMDTLPDSYVRGQIKDKTGLSKEQITPEIIETKRLLIFINRELKNK